MKQLLQRSLHEQKIPHKKVQEEAKNVYQDHINNGIHVFAKK
jgi:hypothetical protein